MADLTSLYQNQPLRDLAIQACVDQIESLYSSFESCFVKGYFTKYIDIQGGTQPPKSQFIFQEQKGYVRFLQIRDFSSDKTPTYIPIDKKNKTCTKDDILLGRYGASVGKILTSKEGAYNVACAKTIIIDSKIVSKKYLFYLLHSSKIQNALKGISRSAQGGFNKGDLDKIEIVIPRTEYQDSIVNLLYSIEAYLIKGKSLDFKQSNYKFIAELIYRFKKQLSVLNEINDLSIELHHQSILINQLRQSILQEAVQGKLLPQNPKDETASVLLEKIKKEKAKLIAEGKLKKEKELPPISKEEIPFELPKGWVWCRLGETCSKIGSGSTPRGGRNVYKSEGVIFLRSQNVYNEGLNLVSVAFIDKSTHMKMSGTKVIANDILLNITGGSIGRSTLIPSDFEEANVSQHVSIIRLLSKMNNSFIHKLILSPYFQDKIMEVQTGGNREGLAKKNMELMLIPLPSLAEQQRIVIKVEALMKTCDALEKEVESLKEQVKALMQAVLREAFESDNSNSKRNRVHETTLS